MKTGELIGEIVKYEDGPKEVYVEVLSRDENGTVIDKKTYPVSSAFAHHENHVVLKCEDSNKEKTEKL